MVDRDNATIQGPLPQPRSVNYRRLTIIVGKQWVNIMAVKLPQAVVGCLAGTYFNTTTI